MIFVTVGTTCPRGFLDIVVKLFVLAQLRAIVTGVERITINILNKVYEGRIEAGTPDAVRPPVRRSRTDCRIFGLNGP